MGDAANQSKSASAGSAALKAARRHLPFWLLPILLALMAIGLYWPALRCGFSSLDDPDYVTANAHVQGGLTWENVGWAFTSVVSGNWHPVTMLSLMLDQQLFGLKPWGYHLTNVLLHACNTALVFVLLRLMTGALWRSALVAALFAVHPLRVESVAWVAERKDVLSAFFGLLALIFYTRYTQVKTHLAQHSALNYCLALLFFALGLMSKPMLVTWPCVMLLLDYWPLGRLKIDEFRLTKFQSLRSFVTRHSSLLLEKVPFFILSAADSVAALAAQKQGGAVITVADFPLSDRVANAVVSCWRYLGKIFWPTDLAVFYPHATHWPLTATLAAGAFLCGVTALAVWGRQRWPFLLVGWLWFLGALVPVIGVVQVGKQAIADRYTYIPSVGMLIFVVWGLTEVARHWRCQKMALAAGAAVVVICLHLTRQQLGYWRDDETLFRHTLAVTKDNFVIHYDLGVVLFDKGRTDEARAQFQDAVRLAPAYADAHVNLGVTLLNLGRINEAIRQFQAAIQLRPDDANAYLNLGVAFRKQGKLDDAISQFQDALGSAPNDAGALQLLRQAEELKQKLDSLGSDPAALNNLAWALATSPDADMRSGALAVQLAERACKATDYRVTMMVGTLAAAYAEAGRFDEAVTTAQKACALASEMGETNLLARNQELLTLYQAHKAYHEPSR